MLKLSEKVEVRYQEDGYLFSFVNHISNVIVKKPYDYNKRR
ncbi:TPA: hypothetical protein ACG3RE_000080 [Clostridioides difficile]